MAQLLKGVLGVYFLKINEIFGSLEQPGVVGAVPVLEELWGPSQAKPFPLFEGGKSSKFQRLSPLSVLLHHQILSVPAFH